MHSSRNIESTFATSPLIGSYLARATSRVRRGSNQRQIQGCLRRIDDAGRDGNMGKDQGVGLTLPTGRPHRPGRAHVEFLRPLQTQAADRSVLSKKHAVYVRRRVLWAVIEH